MPGKPKNKGAHLSLWITDAQAEKLNALSAASGLTRSNVVRRLIDGQAIPEKSYARTLGELGRLGGLIKSHIEGDERAEALAIAREVLDIARELRGASCLPS